MLRTIMKKAATRKIKWSSLWLSLMEYYWQKSQSAGAIQAKKRKILHKKVTEQSKSTGSAGQSSQ